MPRFLILPGNNSQLIKEILFVRGIWQEVNNNLFYIKKIR